jgi:hypothetical protein
MTHCHSASAVRHPLLPGVAGEDRTEPVPLHPHGLLTDVDTALEQQVLDITQRQRESDVRHHHKADHLGRKIEAAERAGRFRSGSAAHLSDLSAWI